MSPRSLFVNDAVIAFVCGVALLAVPGVFVGLFGVESNAVLDLFARLFGAAMLGNGGILWLLRHEAAGAVGRRILRAHLLFDLAAGITTLLAAAAGTINWLGWVLGALFLVFAALRAYWGIVR